MLRRGLDILAMIVAIVGALNWGLIGLFEFDLVAEVVGEEFGEVNLASRIVYVLVAAAGVYLLCPLSRMMQAEAREQRRSASIPQR